MVVQLAYHEHYDVYMERVYGGMNLVHVSVMRSYASEGEFASNTRIANILGNVV